MLNSYSYFRLHTRKATAVFAIAAIQLSLNVLEGKLIALEKISWLDIFGEGSAMLLALGWMALILTSRPAGHVTNFLVIGLCFIFIAFFQDVLDEVIRLPIEVHWDKWLESGSMPIGLAFLTTGMLSWHREQLSINNKLAKRERIFRDHRQYDPVTGVAKANYLRQQIDLEISKIADHQQPLSVLMLDLDNFDQFNREQGYQEGDRFLQELSELLMLNLRRCDLLCRYAGDRFVVVLPSTNGHMAQLLMQQLISACEHFAYKTTSGETVYVGLTGALTTKMKGDAQSILAEAQNRLLQAKDDRPHSTGQLA